MHVFVGVGALIGGHEALGEEEEYEIVSRCWLCCPCPTQLHFLISFAFGRTAFVASLKLHAIASKAIRRSVHLGHCIQDCGSKRWLPQSGAHTYIFFDGTILSL